jgi:hypothetical protein
LRVQRSNLLVSFLRKQESREIGFILFRVQKSIYLW